MGLIGSLTVFYLFILCVTLIFSYLYDDDIWLKGLLIISFVFVFGFFSNHVYNSWQIENNVLGDYDLIVLDSVDVNNYVIVGQENINFSTDYVVTPFINFEDVKEGKYSNVQACILYNNTDDTNIIFFTDGVTSVSEHIYLYNNTVGVVCSEIPSNMTVNNRLLGINCLDCSNSNSLNIPLVDGSLIDKIRIEKADLTNYEIMKSNPPVFYVEARIEPTKAVKDNFFVFMGFAGALILSFILRLVIVFIQKVKEVTLE